MAKMFYTLEEAAEKLGKTPEDVKNMAQSGQIQEFRDRDKLMFKVEQIDLLAGGGDEGGEGDQSEGSISLDDELNIDSGEQSGSGIGLVDSQEDTGISVFDTAHGTAAGDASDATHMTDHGEGEGEEEDLSLEAVGSGSGLLDLTRESDDTSLGAELLEEVYSGDDNVEVPAHASGLFEAAGAESPGNQFGGIESSPSVGPMIVEAYDGAGSGLGVGMMLGAFAALVLAALVIVVQQMGAPSGVAAMMADNVLMWGGILLVVVVILGGIGFFIGKASE